MDVENLNAICARYPRSVTGEVVAGWIDKNYAQGVWYCGKAPTVKAKLYGAYPATFLHRALALFPRARDVLHAPSGSLADLPPGHVTLDLIEDDVRRPMVRGDCGCLPFADHSFDLVLSDPPYSEWDSRIYGCEGFPEREFLRECRRVLRPGGYLGFLHYHFPFHRRGEWKLRGTFAVLTGAGRRVRLFSALQRLPDATGRRRALGGVA